MTILLVERGQIPKLKHADNIADLSQLVVTPANMEVMAVILPF